LKEAAPGGSGGKRLEAWSKWESRREGGTYYEMMRLARQFTPRAAQILIDIASDPGEEARSPIVAIGTLYDRAWGKPKDYDPDSSGKGYSDMSPEERQREVSRLIALD
jgi:hypothetical protein